jgi:hypothetical protein
VSAQSDVDRYRREIQQLLSRIAAETGKVAKARESELRARQGATRTSSAATAQSKLKEADRHSKAAVDAEKRRADYEKSRSTKEAALNRAVQRLNKEQAAQQSRALDDLERRTRAAERQFRSPSQDALADPPAVPPTTNPVAHDVFISHASEDKEEVAGPLADRLRELGVNVWYDDFVLTVGDKLRRVIDKGLASSRFGVIILSPDFFRKEWPQTELDGLAAKERQAGEKVILPIWHRVTKDEVLNYSPTLAEVLALNTAVMTVAQIADEITNVVKATR